MLSREEALARAEALVRALLDEVEQMRPSDYLPWQGHETRGLARPLADALLLAQAEARSRFLGAPMTPETLAEVRTRTEADVKEGYVAGRFTASVADRRALLAHVACLESVLADLREDGAVDPYLKGRQAGRIEGKVECLQALESQWRGLLAEAEWASASPRADLLARADVVRGAMVQVGLDVLDGSEEPDPQGAAP